MKINPVLYNIFAQVIGTCSILLILDPMGYEPTVWEVIAINIGIMMFRILDHSFLKLIHRKP